MKIATHLDHVGHYKTASGKDWTYRVFIMNTHRDSMVPASGWARAKALKPLAGSAAFSSLQEFLN
jgi:hypothetical protein